MEIEMEMERGQWLGSDCTLMSHGWVISREMPTWRSKLLRKHCVCRAAIFLYSLSTRHDDSALQA